MQKQSLASRRPMLSQALCKGYFKKTGPQFYCSVFPVVWNIPLVRWDQLSLLSFVCTPSLLTGVAEWETEKALHCSPIVWPGSFRYSMWGGCSIEYHIYLKIIDITWDFWFSRVIQGTLKTQHKGKIHLDDYSCRTLQNPNPNGIPGTGVYNIHTITSLGVPNGQEGEHGLQPTQAHCSLQNSLASFVVYVPCVGLSHIFVASASAVQQ